MELLPYLYDSRRSLAFAQGRSQEFFTRTSLRALLRRSFRQAEIFAYGEHSLRSRDGIPLYVHCSLWLLSKPADSGAGITS
jgi:hypothetical protein